MPHCRAIARTAAVSTSAATSATEDVNAKEPMNPFLELRSSESSIDRRCKTKLSQ